MSRIPGAKHVLIWGGGALGVNSARQEAEKGNYATAFFDLAAATYPAAAEYGRKLPDFPSLSFPEFQPQFAAATVNGRTVTMGEDASGARLAPTTFEARARAAAGGETSGAKATPSVRARLREAGRHGLPGGSQSTQAGPFRYRPPEGYRPGNPLPRGRQGGYLDRFGNEWVEGPYHGDPAKNFTREWDVQLSPAGRAHFKQFGLGEKGYINVAPDGTLSH